MYTYHCLNNISHVGLRHFNENYKQVDTPDADAILVRSANMKEMEFSDNLKCIARAGAGVNNIPLDVCSEKGIVVFNTPGANANGVKELVIAGMLLASRDIVGGIEWLEKQETTEDLPKKVEKQSAARSSVSSVSVRLALWLQMQQRISVWKSTDMTRSSPCRRHGACPAIFIT